MNLAGALAALGSLLLPGLVLAVGAAGRQWVHDRRRRAAVRELRLGAAPTGDPRTRAKRENLWLRTTTFLGKTAEEPEGLQWVLRSLADVDVTDLRSRAQASFEPLTRSEPGVQRTRRWRRRMIGHLLVLRESPHDDLLTPLAGCLLHADPEVAGTAALVTGHRPEHYAGAALGLAAALLHPSPRAVGAQIWCLTRLLDAHVSLVEVLEEDPAPVVRRVAVRSAGGHLARKEEAAGRAGLAALVERRLLDPDLTVRRAAFEAVRHLEPARQLALCEPALHDADPQIRRTAAATLAAGGQEGVTLLVNVLPDSEPSVRREILALLEDAQTGVPEGVRNQIESGEAQSRRWAVEAVGALGDASEIPGIVPLLDSQDGGLRVAAARALAALGRKDAAQTALRTALRRMLPAWHREDDPAVVVALADVLAQTGDPEARTALLVRLGSAQAGVRERLLEELARCEQLAGETA